MTITSSRKNDSPLRMGNNQSSKKSSNQSSNQTQDQDSDLQISGRGVKHDLWRN